ncbi:MAG: sugar-binding protein [Bacteroidota bacterium]
MKNFLAVSLLFIGLIISTFSNGQTVAVTKTNPTKVYMHYMPWFSAPQNPGSGTTSFGNGNTGATNKWGQHWSRVGNNTKFPDNFITVTDYRGLTVQTRDICAHYHPLIGPYDGKDTAVIEYHLLLMKLSGIDGVMIDWYGKGGNGAGDAAPLLVNSNALINGTEETGLKFALTMEDAAWKDINAAIDNGNYAINNYFNKPEYVKLGDLRGSNATSATAPLITVFGPQKFKTPGQWNTILSGNTQAFLPLYNQSAQIGADAGGEFAWPYPQAVLGGNANAWYTNLSGYYQTNAAGKNIVLGTAFPGFKDFYGTNGASQYGIIPRTYSGTTTLKATLDLYTQRQSVLDGLQLATWNDFSEGTIIEPTVEEGFQSLDTIQRFTGVPYTVADLEEVYRLFLLRKKFAGNPAKQLQLNQVFNFFTSLQIPQAVELMNAIDNINAPKVSLSSTGAVTEDGGTGSITITATNITNDLSVHYTLEGTRVDSLYTITPALPDSLVFTPTNTSYTFTIAAVDDTIVNRNKTILFKLISDTTFNINGSGIATFTVGDNEVPPCEGAIITNTILSPLIDGAADSLWLRAPVNDIGKTISGTIQTGSTWQAMYDATNLYVFVKVKDSTLSNLGYNDWDQDGVEIYISGSNNRNGIYNNTTDHQYRFNWNMLPYSTRNIQGNTNSKDNIVYAIPTTTDGYTLEVAIPWATIGGGTPFNFKEIGFDININDQHDGAAQREATVGWNSTNSDNYLNTTNFGSVPLVICKASPLLPSPVITSLNIANGKEYVLFNYTILASNSPVYTLTDLPLGLNINAMTGVISGTPSLRGEYTVNVTATNNSGTHTQELIIIIDSNAAVKYSSINAVRQSATIEIQFMVDSEIAIQQYEIQRSSDSVNFTTINTITSIGNDNMMGVFYNSTDQQPLTTVSYYRIKGTAQNGFVYLSDIAKATAINAAGVYPNPLSGNYINIPFYDQANASTYKVRLVNSMGQVLYTSTLAVSAGNSIMPFFLNKKPGTGIYQLELQNNNGIRKTYSIVIGH